jgi:enamine deaminase RidA (YjgF/YER057c/UK114 family)
MNQEQYAAMSQLEKKLHQMGFTLPTPFKFPNPNRTGCVQVGKIVFVSGHGRDLPKLPGIKHRGKVPTEVSVEEGYATARAVGLSILASLKAQFNDLDKIKRVVRLFGMVNVTPGFDRMPNVIDGASDFFFELFGPVNGQHARTAVGMAELPHRIPVEINGEFELHE